MDRIDEILSKVEQLEFSIGESGDALNQVKDDLKAVLENQQTIYDLLLQNTHISTGGARADNQLDAVMSKLRAIESIADNIERRVR